MNIKRQSLLQGAARLFVCLDYKRSLMYCMFLILFLFSSSYPFNDGVTLVSGAYTGGWLSAGSAATTTTTTAAAAAAAAILAAAANGVESAGLPYGTFGGVYGGHLQGPGYADFSCSTPSVLLPSTRIDMDRCRSDYSVLSLTDNEWNDLKWGSIEIMCRPSTNTLTFFLENCPRFSWNPFRIAASTARRVAGSVDIRTASTPLSSFCECSNVPTRPFFVELFKKEQYIVGARVQSMPRKVYEFFGEDTNCEAPR